MSLIYIFRKWSSFATGGLRKSVVGLSSLLPWPVMDMFTHLVKVHFIISVYCVVERG